MDALLWRRVTQWNIKYFPEILKFSKNLLFDIINRGYRFPIISILRTTNQISTDKYLISLEEIAVNVIYIPRD